MSEIKTPGFKNIPQTGVIYVTSQAEMQGFSGNHSGWSNLGQGSPQADAIEGAPPRLMELKINPEAHHYSAIAGHRVLREKIADFYNTLFRKEKKSQYTYENVCIAGGGRQALSRLVAALSDINMGHFLPDYTAYEELLNSFKNITPIPILLESENRYKISLDLLKKEILGRGLRSLLISNPCNPTGQVIFGTELKAWVNLARECECSFIIDEFYSHYIYDANIPHHMVSAAEYIEDVNKDPVIIVDGITKNWRYPGWRISWILGPKEIIQSTSSTGSFLDGGANHPFQRGAEQLLDAEFTRQETEAIFRHFSKKRQLTIDRLRDLGIIIHAEPAGGFYVWADLSALPAPLHNSKDFFAQGLLEKVITVPGYFFDVNPGGRRIKTRRFTDHCRISFGPELPVLERGLDAIERVIRKFQ